MGLGVGDGFGLGGPAGRDPDGLGVAPGAVLGGEGGDAGEGGLTGAF